ncbi:MAG: ion channel [Bacteroidetes bacterium]|nr:ion channel [Bacteroidota bacterium]MCL5737216.1 ion channel [Bacteroidota bacterium]
MSFQENIHEFDQENQRVSPQQFVAEQEKSLQERIMAYLFIGETDLRYIRKILGASYHSLLQEFENDRRVAMAHYVGMCERLAVEIAKTVGSPAGFTIEELHFQANKTNLKRTFRAKWWASAHSLIDLVWASVLFFTRPRYWLYASIGSVLTFALLFWITGSLHGPIQDSRLGFWDCLFCSMMAVTAGYGDIHPDATGKALLFIEVAVGYVLFGILISIIMKKIIRY